MDLALATTDELIAELAKRHSGMVLALERPAEGNGTENETHIQYKGGPNLGLGLAKRAELLIRRDILIHTGLLEDEEDDDDGTDEDA